MSAAGEVRICRPCGKPAAGNTVRCVRGDQNSGWVAVSHKDCYAAHLNSLNDDLISTTFTPAPA